MDQPSSERNGQAESSTDIDVESQARSVRRLLSDPSVFAHLSDIVAVYDRHMRFLYVSRTVEPYDPSAVIGVRVLDNIAPEDRDRFAQAFNQTWETGQPRVVECRDLQGCWWATRLARVCGPDGVAHMLGAVVDITTRKAAEMALAEREQRLRASVEASGVGTWTWRADSDELVLDDGLCRILAIDSADAPTCSRDYLKYVVAEDRARADDSIQRAVREGVYDDFEHRVVRADGQIRHLFSRGSVVVGDDGRVTGLRGGVLDITARKQLEEQLRQVQRMDAIGQLTAGIAHNFNNLLAVILPNVGLCRVGPREEVPLYLDDIEQASERAMEMVRQLMRIARHEVGTEKGPTDLVALARRTERICRSTFDRNIEIEFEAAPHLPPVLASAGDIEQVLLNVCINARDALAEGQVKQPRISIKLDRDSTSADTVRVRVSDNGPGMDEARRARVFEPFFTTKPVGRGTGLGLATAYGIVTEHRGTLRCQSTRGHGAVFTLELPIARDLPRADSLRVESSGLGGRESVLVVDDEPLVRRALRAVLGRAGYDVIEASDGDEGLSVLMERGRHVDLVLLDRSMPKMRGEDFLARLRLTGPDVPIILFTGEATNSAVDLPGVCAVILKPPKTEELYRKIREVLDAAQASKHGSHDPLGDG